jgi:glycosyltransferase involved in cell wall biosynthesis
VADRTHFLGVRADVAELLSASDIFALASDWEGSPVSVMEAMAAGLPVAATAAGGVPELVEHGVTGLLAAPGDAPALADALAALARDPRRRREFAERSRERALRFSIGTMVAAYSDLFERVAAGRP